jgi:zinc finger CCCH domain-containing protein 13
MGSFKHQPLRGDRDRDLTRERERDLRGKEDQERLRSVSAQVDQNNDVLNLRQLSDKYDRERLSLGSGSALRGKERELAPHLNTASSSRLNGQTTSARRSEGREPREPGKRKAGESSDDWRRGKSHSFAYHT